MASPNNPTRLSVSVRLPFDVFQRRPSVPDRVLLLLHGYTETGRRIFRKLEPIFQNTNALVLSPNGPYPVPVRMPPEKPGESETFREGYAWYFYDPSDDEYVRDMSVALDALEQTMTQLAPPGLPIDIVGFSQGTYLAPFAATRFGARRVIGVAGRFLDEEIPGVPAFELHGIHGEEDPVVSAAEARKSFDALAKRGARGSFVSIANSAHRIDEKILVSIASRLSHE